jgi:hypothetical protein
MSIYIYIAPICEYVYICKLAVLGSSGQLCTSILGVFIIVCRVVFHVEWYVTDVARHTVMHCQYCRKVMLSDCHLGCPCLFVFIPGDLIIYSIVFLGSQIMSLSPFLVIFCKGFWIQVCLYLGV